MTAPDRSEAWPQLPNYCGRCAAPLTESDAVHKDDGDPRVLFKLAPAYSDIPDDLTVAGYTVYCPRCARELKKEAAS